MLVNGPPLPLPLPRDQRMWISVNARSRSFPVTIRETSSHRNRPLGHRGSNNDSDHGCKISRLSGHFPLVVNNRSEGSGCTSTSLPFPQLCSRSRNRNSSHRSGSERHSLGVILSIEPRTENVNHLTIDIISYIMSQMPAFAEQTCSDRPAPKWSRR